MDSCPWWHDNVGVEVGRPSSDIQKWELLELYVLASFVNDDPMLRAVLPTNVTTSKQILPEVALYVHFKYGVTVYCQRNNNNCYIA